MNLRSSLKFNIYLIFCAFIFSLLSTAALAQRKVNDIGAHHILFRTSVNGSAPINFAPSAPPTEWYLPAKRFGLSIGFYHEDSATVDAQITALKQSGAGTIVFDLWSSDLSSCEASGACNDGYLDGVWGEVLDNGQGMLRPQHKANLEAMLNKVKQVGFDRVVIRFNHYWPSNTQSWNETLYQMSWNFIYWTKSQVESNLSGSQTEALYDLGGELAGRTDGQVAQFINRLWGDYNTVWGNTKTVGFSFAWATGRFAQAKQTYLNAAQPLPKIWAFDIYSMASGQPSIYDQLQSVSNEMGPLNGQPIILFETWHNDSDVASSINTALNGSTQIPNLNLEAVFQWPVKREDVVSGAAMHISQSAINSQNTSSQLSNYLALKAPHKLRLQNSNSIYMVIRDKNCAQTMSYIAGCNVEHFTASAPSGKYHQVMVNGNLMACVGQQDITQQIPWIVAGQIYNFTVYQVSVCTSAVPSSSPIAESTVTAIF